MLRACVFVVGVLCAVPATAQLVVHEPIPFPIGDEITPDTPLTEPFRYWPIEIDADHPGPELLVYQLLGGEYPMLATGVLDHPTRKGWHGQYSGPGMCLDHPVVTFAFVDLTVLDWDRDGRDDFVLVRYPDRTVPIALRGLGACKVP